MSLYGSSNAIGITEFNNVVATPNAHALWDHIITGTLGPNLTSLTDLISGVTYFNFNQDMFEFNTSQKVLGFLDDNIFGPNYIVKSLPNVAADSWTFSDGFFMGATPHTAIYQNFMDFEPYTTCQVYLPYFGLVELSIKDIYGKWIYFRLVVDVQTCQGVYYIYTNDNEISGNLSDRKNKFLVDGLGNSKLIGTYACYVGAEVPLNTTGSSERNRNIILSTVKTAANIGALVATQGMASSVVLSETFSSPYTEQLYERNPNTNRLIKTQEIVTSNKDKVRKTTSSVNNTRNTVFEAASCANQIFGNIVSRPEQSFPNNSVLSIQETQKIHLIYKVCKPVPINISSYKHILGMPLGTYKKVNELSGFTKFVNFHLSTQNTSIQNNATSYIGLINSEELEMINDLMLSGVYL